MAAISLVVGSFINGQKDYCCLCLNSVHGKAIELTDTVVIDINNEDCDTPVEKILQSVFDHTMLDYITTFSSVCEMCMKLAISYYAFKETCHQVSGYVTNVLETITHSFDYAPDDFGDSKSLFVSLNLQDFTSTQFYDVKKISSTRKAILKNFHSLTNKVKDEKVIKKEEAIDKSTKKKSNNIEIPISTMLKPNNDPNTIQCNNCLKMFTSLTYLKYHFIRVHAPKKYKCPDCPKAYGSLACFNNHKKESHCNLICGECGKSFNNRNSFRSHELGHKVTFVCPNCGRVYKNRATFKKHIEQKVCGQNSRASPADAKFTCDYCNKKYTQKMSLRVHIQYEHGNYKAHVCEWCGKKFWAQSRLKAHIVKHTREKNFQCNICGSRFVSKESCLYHTRTHTGERPYKCPHCEAWFLSASRRSYHVKSYHLGGTLECDVCYSKFKSRQSLLRHKKTHCNKAKPYEPSGSDVRKSTQHYHNKNKSKHSTSNPEHSTTTAREIWKISEVNEVGIQSFQNVIDSAEIQIQNLDHETYIDQPGVDGQIYITVPDPDDFMKLGDIGS